MPPNSPTTRARVTPSTARPDYKVSRWLLSRRSTEWSAAAFARRLGQFRIFLPTPAHNQRGLVSKSCAVASQSGCKCQLFADGLCSGSSNESVRDVPRDGIVLNGESQSTRDRRR